MTHSAPRRRALGALVAVLCCAGLLVGAPASGTAPSSTSAKLIAIQLAPLPAVVTHRRVLTLRSSGALPGATMRFYRTPAGGSQQLLGTKTATAEGTAALRVRVLTNATYVAVMDNGGTPLSSNERMVGVTRVLGLARTVVDADRRTVRFTATVSTGSAPGTLALQRRRGDRWATVGSWPARARVVRTLVVPRGRSVHRVVVKATRSYRSSVSRSVAVRVG